MSTIKLQEQFNKKADRLLLQLQARKQENEREQYVLSTKAGTLEIALDTPEKSSVFSIYCKFPDVDTAKVIMGKFENFNPYSGKWNFHHMDSDCLLQVFENDVMNILN
jgi:hypothetical protein